MPNDPSAPTPGAAVDSPPQIRHAQLHAAALLVGVLAFTVVAVVVGPIAPPTPPTAAAIGPPFDELLLGLLAALCVLFLGVYFAAIRPAFRRRMRAEWTGDPQTPPLATCFKLLMLRTHFIEIAGLLAALIVLLHARYEALAVVAAAVVGFAATFPTERRVARLLQWAAPR